MDQSKISVRYAKALFELGKEKEQLETFNTGVGLVASVLQSNADFNFLLANPVIPASKKIKAIRLIFQDKIEKTALRFLELVVENKREQYLGAICRNFQEMVRREQGIKTAVVTSAVPLSREMADKMRALLESSLQLKLEMSEKVDETLLVGFVLRVDDLQYDASISTRLGKVKEALLKTDIK